MGFFRRIKQQIISTQCEPVLQDIRNLRLDIVFEESEEETKLKNTKKLYQSVIDAKKEA